eukprot:COSAG05_NODE_19346_length_294_cov_0.784615_1_plen_47_part_10
MRNKTEENKQAETKDVALFGSDDSDSDDDLELFAAPAPAVLQAETQA